MRENYLIILTFNMLNYFAEFNNIADFHGFNFGTKVHTTKPISGLDVSANQFNWINKAET